MIYGLTGASGTSKTTLGRELSKRLDIPFVPTSITEMAADLGLPSPVAPLNLNDRTVCQVELLTAMCKFLESLPHPCIIDRTPLDLLAYMLAEVHMHAHIDASEILMGVINDYSLYCIGIAKRFLTVIYCLEPLPTYEVDSKRPAWNPAYHRHVQWLIKGVMAELSGFAPHFTVPAMSLEERTELVGNSISSHMDAIQKQREAAVLH